MGICESINNKESKAINDDIKNPKVEIDTGRPLNSIDINVYNVIKSVCKIMTNNGSGTGFLIKLYRNKKEFFCLMTNEHIVKKEMINLKEKINIFYDAQNEIKEIILNTNERYIKEYKYMNLDITIIEIIKEDNIDKKYFLLPYIEEYNPINNKIYIVQFPHGNLCHSKGEIIEINKYEMTYDVHTEIGASGSPIFLENTTRVIGIHKEGDKINKKNYGDFIYPIIKDLESNILYYEDGSYYKGELINGLRNGKGIDYYKNGKIGYDGDFVNDKYEGNGKYIFENGEYYIGEWSNGQRHGKGAMYLNNGYIKYAGIFINGTYEGEKNKPYVDNIGSIYFDDDYIYGNINPP